VVGLRTHRRSVFVSEEWKRAVEELREDMSSALFAIERLSRDAAASMGAEVAFELAARSISTALIAIDEWTLSYPGAVS
jgi:hypothetical protein